MWKCLQYIKEPAENKLNTYFSVQVQEPETGLLFWLDVGIDKLNDLCCDWNQYIFFKDNKEDMIRQNIQENNNNFYDAVASAICYLESLNLIKQSDEGEWDFC